MVIEYTIHHLLDHATGRYCFDRESVLCSDEAHQFVRDFERIVGKPLAMGYHPELGITIQVVIDDDGEELKP